VRDTDTIARLGGDEFAIVQDAVEQPQNATALAIRLIELLSAPYDLDGHRLIIGATVGIAIAPNDGADAEQLLKNADLALYRAKADGRGTHRFFEPDMDARMQARHRLELDLRNAIVAREFEVHYQPLVNLRKGEVSGFEALLRWRHPTKGIISPAHFIPLAEEIGLISTIGEFVLRQACADAKTWDDSLSVAVNLSPVQFRSSAIVAVVSEALAVSQLAATRLELEITETVMLQDTETTLVLLGEIKALGVRISMDDFGTGNSSLSYLRRFPFDKVKIDRSFVRELGLSADCDAIVQAVAGLGHSLGMETAAEGVETVDQLERLRSERCTEVQGFLFSPAVPAAEVPNLLDRLRPLVSVPVKLQPCLRS
jgi:predicted signal transduction protein with EAL and GGDEF domain